MKNSKIVEQKISMDRLPTLDEIKPGFKAKIIQQGTGKECVGIVDSVISKFNHPNGVFVKLKIKIGSTLSVRGRVIEILETKISENDSSYVVAPESTNVEYKLHFIYFHVDDGSGKKEWIVEHNVYKTIAAFANGEGGKLIIGIHDNGKIYGLQSDYDELKRLQDVSNSIFPPNRDGMEIKIKSDCKKYFKNQVKLSLDLIAKIEFPKIGDKEICEITVLPSYEHPLILYQCESNLLPKPTLYMKKENGSFVEFSKDKSVPLYYVRKGNSSEQYTETEFFEFWVRRIKLLT